MNNDSNEQVVSEIKTRIRSLADLSGIDLKNEMGELKTAIKENPQACLLLLPEDIGEMVVQLRRIVGTALAVASSKTREKKPKEAGVGKKMTAAELAAALDDDDF